MCITSSYSRHNVTFLYCSACTYNLYNIMCSLLLFFYFIPRGWPWPRGLKMVIQSTSWNSFNCQYYSRWRTPTHVFCGTIICEIDQRVVISSQNLQATPFAKGVACGTLSVPAALIAFSMRHAERKGSGLRDYSTACGSPRYGHGWWIVAARLVDAHQLHASWRTDIVLTLRY